MQILILFFTSSFSLQVIAQQAGPIKKLKTLSYTISNQKENPYHLMISLKFHADPSGHTLFILPAQTAGISELYKNIINLHAFGATLQQTNLLNEFYINSAPNAEVQVTYQVAQSWKGPLNDHNQFRAPIIQPSYFQFKGESFFAYPAYDKNKKLVVSFLWHLPTSWAIANSYALQNTNKSLQVLTTLNDLSESLFLGGDFRLRKSLIKNSQIITAMRGNWLFSDRQFNHAVLNIISYERSFWQDTDQPFFLISLLPLNQVCNSRGGTGLRNSFAAFMGESCNLDESILTLLAHENFHHWNTPTIFKDITDQNDKSFSWFIEGFTNYYASLFMLRVHLISFDAYIANYNKVLRDYYSSSANHMSTAMVQKYFWKNTALQRLPYQQGEILAHNWNAEIKLISHRAYSLDTLMRLWIRTKNPADSKLTYSTMSVTAYPYLKRNIQNDIQAVVHGKLITPNKDALGPCVKLKEQTNISCIPQYEIIQNLWHTKRDYCLDWFQN